MTDRASVPDFELPATGAQRFQPSAFHGHPFVLYFYPRDDTPGCTDEGIQFRTLHPEFVTAKVATEVQVSGSGPFVLTYVNAADDPSKRMVKK